MCVVATVMLIHVWVVVWAGFKYVGRPAHHAVIMYRPVILEDLKNILILLEFLEILTNNHFNSVIRFFSSRHLTCLQMPWHYEAAFLHGF